MKLKMRVTGQQAGVAGGLDHLVADQVKRTMQEKVKGLTCPEHNMEAAVQVNGDSIATFKIQVHACCDAMRKRVAKALA
jgi:hypothetical protein